MLPNEMKHKKKMLKQSELKLFLNAVSDQMYFATSVTAGFLLRLKQRCVKYCFVDMEQDGHPAVLCDPLHVFPGNH